MTTQHILRSNARLSTSSPRAPRNEYLIVVRERLHSRRWATQTLYFHADDAIHAAKQAERHIASVPERAARCRVHAIMPSY